MCLVRIDRHGNSNEQPVLLGICLLTFDFCASASNCFTVAAAMLLSFYSKQKSTAAALESKRAVTHPRCHENCHGRQNARCQGCRAECFTLKPTSLVSVKVCQGKDAVCRGVKNMSPDIFVTHSKQQRRNDVI